MWVTGSRRAERLLLGCWIVSAVVNVYLMWILPGAETIPFHLVWIGLSIIYGYVTWRSLGMAVVLVCVAVSTGSILAHHANLGLIGWEETSEVPLMSALFVVMVWHVRRRQQALAEVARLAENERQRAEVQQMFVRFASHELRTPITVARGYTELVRARGTDETAYEDSTIVIEELDKLSRITRRLVTLMRFDQEDRREPGDVDAELARIVRRWEPAADRAFAVESSVGTAWIDPDRLETAVDSLVENAVKFTAPGDRIRIVGSADADGWSVTVHDRGAGMTAELAAALTAADAPPVRTESGTGLGLAIARAVATSWGGTLGVSGGTPAGTEVTLRFPWRSSTPGPDPDWTFPLRAVLTHPMTDARHPAGTAPTPAD